MRRVLVRYTSEAGVYLRKQAERIGHALQPGSGMNRIEQGFLLRGRSDAEKAVVTVIELPLYIAGAYGGIDAGYPDIYTQAAAVGAVGLLTFIPKDEVKLDEDSNPIPWLEDMGPARVPMGSGYVQIGDLPPWSAYREARADGTGPAAVCASALLVNCVARLEDADPPYDIPYSLILTRSSPRMRWESTSDSDGNPLPLSELGLFEGHPTVSNQVAESLDSVALIEFSQSLFDLDGDVYAGGPNQERFDHAGPSLEWGPAHGVVSFTTVVNGSATVRIGFAGYTLTQGESTVTGALDWQHDIVNSSLPGGDASPGIPARPSVAHPSYFYSWADRTTVNGSPEVAASMFFSDISSPYMNTLSCLSLWSSGVGEPYDEEAPQPGCIGVVTLRTKLPGGAIVARGARLGGSGYEYIDTPTYEAETLRYFTYAFTVSSSGITLNQIANFDESRYSALGETVRWHFVTYGGVNAADGSPRAIAVKRAVHYDVIAATSDSGLVSAEPARKERNAYYQWSKPADVTPMLITGGGTQTPLALGSFYVPFFDVTTGDPGDGPAGTRYHYAPPHPEDGHVDYCRVRSEPFCQYAPGIMAALVSPVSDFLSPVHALRVALFDVATGALLQLSPVVVSYATRVELSLTCVEQATLDDDSNIVTHGRLLLSMSTTLTAPNRGDGMFVINNFADITWLTREPSNVWGVYVGSQLLPATLGVTSGSSALK